MSEYRLSFCRWLNRSIAKTPEGNIQPWWVLRVWGVLHPIKAIIYRVGKHHGYQPMTDTWKIGGYEFSDGFFRSMANAKGEKMIVTAKDDGVISPSLYRKFLLVLL